MPNIALSFAGMGYFEICAVLVKFMELKLGY